LHHETQTNQGPDTSHPVLRVQISAVSRKGVSYNARVSVNTYVALVSD